MRWFRTHIRWGSRLALFALAVQLLLAFSHVHGFQVAPASTGIALADQAAGGDAGSPTHKRHGPSDPGCAICALIQLAATAALAAPPALPERVRSAELRLAAPAQAALAAWPYGLFRARAPPMV